MEIEFHFCVQLNLCITFSMDMFFYMQRSVFTKILAREEFASIINPPTPNLRAWPHLDAHGIPDMDTKCVLATLI